MNKQQTILVTSLNLEHQFWLVILRLTDIKVESKNNT